MKSATLPRAGLELVILSFNGQLHCQLRENLNQLIKLMVTPVPFAISSHICKVVKDYMVPAFFSSKSILTDAKMVEM